MHLRAGRAHHLLLWLRPVHPPDSLRVSLASASTSGTPVAPLLPTVWQGQCRSPCHALLWHRSPPSVPTIAISASCLGLFMPLELFSYDSSSPVPTSYCVRSCIYPLLWAQGPSRILQAFFSTFSSLSVRTACHRNPDWFML